MTDQRIEMATGDHAYTGTITTSGIAFSPLQESAIEYKTSRVILKAFSDLTFSPLLLAQVILSRFPAIITKRVFYFCRDLIGLLADQWDAEMYESDLSEEAWDAGIMRQALKDADRWDL